MSEEAIVILLIMLALICWMLSFMRAIKIRFNHDIERRKNDKINEDI